MIAFVEALPGSTHDLSCGCPTLWVPPDKVVRGGAAGVGGAMDLPAVQGEDRRGGRCRETRWQNRGSTELRLREICGPAPAPPPAAALTPEQPMRLDLCPRRGNVTTQRLAGAR